MACSKPVAPNIPENIEFLKSQYNRGTKRNLTREVQRCLQNRCDVILSENELILLTNIERRSGSRKVLLTIAKFRACSQNTRTRYRREAVAFYERVKTGSRKLTYEEAKFLLKPENREDSTNLGLVPLAEEVICPLVEQKQHGSHSEVSDELPTIEQFVDQILCYNHIATAAEVQHDEAVQEERHTAPPPPSTKPASPLVSCLLDDKCEQQNSWGHFLEFEQHFPSTSDTTQAPIHQVLSEIEQITENKEQSLEAQLADKLAKMRVDDTLRNALGQVRLTEEQLNILSQRGATELKFDYKRICQHHQAAKRLPLSTLDDLLSLLHQYRPTLTLQDYETGVIPKTAKTFMKISEAEKKKYQARPVKGWQKGKGRIKKAGSYMHFDLPKVHVYYL